MMRCWVEIENQNGCYTGSIHHGNRIFIRPLPKLRLGLDEKILIKGRPCRLGDLVQVLLAHKPQEPDTIFDERGQLEIGRYLYQQIFDDIHPSRLKLDSDDQVDLRIVTDDEHIARLPWVLLAHKGTFLSTSDWSVSLARTCYVKNCTLPPSPRMLVIAPEPVGMPGTRAESHLEMLDYQLSPYDYRLSLGDHIQVAHTWEQYCQLLQEFKTHIVYYYGHGVGNLDRSRLVFATGRQQRRVEKPIADFAQCLRELEEPPRLVYLNCCSGDAGGFLGAGWQLGNFIAAVITNRTVAHTNTAQAQALALWQSILLDGLPPHLAMTRVRSRLVDLGLSFSDAQWLTPVIHCHYADWKSTPPQRVDPLKHDPHWHLKLNRVKQFGIVSYETQQMLREQRPRSMAYVWYGQKGQGVDLFHWRLTVELREHLATHAHFLQINPDWPMDLYDPDRSFSDMMCDAFQREFVKFDVRSLKDIPDCIRAYTRGARGRQTLVYVRHQPVRSKLVMNPRTLCTYLQWWDREFVPLLKDRFYALLTVSFVVDNSARFHKVVEPYLYDLEFSNTICRLLDEMERLGKKDLLDFLQAHKIRLPRRHKDRILQEILEYTNGHYELTISALKRLVSRALDTIEGKAVVQEQTDEFDY